MDDRDGQAASLRITLRLQGFCPQIQVVRQFSFAPIKVRHTLPHLLCTMKRRASHRNVGMEEQFNRYHGATVRSFSEGQKVLVRDYSGRQSTRIPGFILRRRGRCSTRFKLPPSGGHATQTKSGQQMRKSCPRDRSGAATAEKPSPRRIGQNFGTIAGPASSPDWSKICTQQPIMTQYWPNAGCHRRIQNASGFPESCCRLRHVYEALYKCS
ncbi:hypothetical protein CLF_102177 [Clonorchis sinensis]|uniref:Uncharacterized protein n=1 Tax=Clonorchis sinensis TaxID=79923 RepID=G7Y7F2_CLOSI|nr:hypothetical protein CLF_102177 [Clonorchis sinensis]